MKQIDIVLIVLSLLLAYSASASPLHSHETQSNEQARLEAQAHPGTAIRSDSLNFDYHHHPRVISDNASSVDGGNKNKTLGGKITQFFHDHKWMYGVVSACALGVLIVAVVLLCLCGCICYRNQKCNCSRRGPYQLVPHVGLVDSTDMSNASNESCRPKRPLQDNKEDNALRHFLDNNEQYEFNDEKLDDLGSRVQKNWYAATLIQGEEHTRVILTVAPLSASCPLQMHKHQKGLNKLLAAIKVHPFVHPILEVSYLATHDRVVVAQPKMLDGSLKDLIYKVSHPTLDWSQKYGNRSSGLLPEKVARYGRQILEAVEFLYDRGFPTVIGHIQSGNIFVVNDVCKLGGYENTLLGYKTRIYKLCKDHMDRFDTILFGHLIFEMSAGYELKQLVPMQDDYKTVHKSIRPVLEFICNENSWRSISDIKMHNFFDVLLPETKDFKAAEVQLTDSMRVVLEKVRKNKPRVQKPPSAKMLKMASPTSTMDSKLLDQPQTSSSWKDRIHDVPKQLKQFFAPAKKKEHQGGGGNCINDDDDEPLLQA